MLSDREIRNITNNVESYDDFMTVLNKLKKQLNEQKEATDRIETIHYICKLAKKNMSIVEESQALSTSYKDLYYELCDDSRIKWIDQYSSFGELIRTRFIDIDPLSGVTVEYQDLNTFENLFENIKSSTIDNLHENIDDLIKLWQSPKYENTIYFKPTPSINFDNKVILTKPKEANDVLSYLLGLKKTTCGKDRQSIICHAIFKIVDCCTKHKPNNFSQFKTFCNVIKDRYNYFLENEPITHVWLHDFDHFAQF